MTRYTLRALAAQWRAWSGTVAVLALAAGLVNVCLVHRMTSPGPTSSRGAGGGRGPGRAHGSGGLGSPSTRRW